MFHFYPCKMDHFMVIVLLAKIKWAISIRTWQVFVLNASSCEPESVIDVTVVVAVLFSASTTATRNFFSVHSMFNCSHEEMNALQINMQQWKGETHVK